MISLKSDTATGVAQPIANVAQPAPIWETYRDAIGTIIKLPDDLKEASKYNHVQKMAKLIKTRTIEELWELVHAANERHAPAGSWPFKFRKMEQAAHSKEQKKWDMDFWTGAELRTILSIAQNLQPTSQFYESLRLQHKNYVDDHGTLAKGPTFQGDGAKAFQNCTDGLSTVELRKTKGILHTSVGWSLLFDNKGRWTTKGEHLLFRD